jgi:uncharacterized protein (TIGR02300 family)
VEKSDRGTKHVCAECAAKYYDLQKSTVACPRCGARPLVVKPAKAKRPTASVWGGPFQKYP